MRPVEIQLFSFVLRKREEEQRRREAVQKVSVASAEKRRLASVRAEQDKSLVNIIEDLSINDSVAETKKSSKEERHKGRSMQKCAWFCSSCFIVYLVF